MRLRAWAFTPTLIFVFILTIWRQMDFRYKTVRPPCFPPFESLQLGLFNNVTDHVRGTGTRKFLLARFQATLFGLG